MENNRYQMLKRIGEGVHGVVIKAVDVTNNKYVAIKKVPLKTKYGGISPNTLREIKTLQHCDCENVSSSCENWKILGKYYFSDSNIIRYISRYIWPVNCM